MVRLGRFVRFSVNPFLDHDDDGVNAYASRPCGEGLALFLELGLELVGPAAPETGLLVNVSEIDAAVRRCVVPLVAESIRERARRGEHIPLSVVADLLRLAHERLDEAFARSAGCVDRITLKLNPFRTLAMNAHEPGMIYFSEKFEFAATHTLWNDDFPEQWNRETFGKCANPTGHGHNYIVEVTVAMSAEAARPQVGRFEQIVDSRLMQLVDHRNLNTDVPEFGRRIATVENLAVFAWERLVGWFEPARLHCVTISESDRTRCTYYGR